MSDDGISCTKSRLLELLVELDDVELDSIEQWICSRAYKQDLESKKSLKSSEKKLIKIGSAIKKYVPFEAEMATENIVPPSVGDQADCSVANTYHIDEFLYNQSEVDELVKEGKIKRHYCLDCNSRNVKELTYISHSMSRQALQYIFKVLLPRDLHEKQILDVGSRIGAVLYGAYHLSNASHIIGIEMNKECCDVQEKIIEQFSMDRNRVKVIHSDVMERSDVVEQANIVIVNVLDFFVDTEKHKQMWYFFKKHIKKGTYLVSNRSMVDTLGCLDMFEELMNWLSICKPNQMENETYFDVEDCCEIFLYVVN